MLILMWLLILVLLLLLILPMMLMVNFGPDFESRGIANIWILGFDLRPNFTQDSETQICFMLFELVKVSNTSVSSAFGNVFYLNFLNFTFKLTLCFYCVPFCQSALVAGSCRLKKSHHGN